MVCMYMKIVWISSIKPRKTRCTRVNYTHNPFKHGYYPACSTFLSASINKREANRYTILSDYHFKIPPKFIGAATDQSLASMLKRKAEVGLHFPQYPPHRPMTFK